MSNPGLSKRFRIKLLSLADEKPTSTEEDLDITEQTGGAKSKKQDVIFSNKASSATKVSAEAIIDNATKKDFLDTAAQVDEGDNEVNPDLTGGTSLKELMVDVLTGGNKKKSKKAESDSDEDSDTELTTSEDSYDVDQLINEMTKLSDNSDVDDIDEDSDVDDDEITDSEYNELLGDDEDSAGDDNEDSVAFKEFLKQIKEQKKPQEDSAPLTGGGHGKPTHPLIGGNAAPKRSTVLTYAYPYILKQNPNSKKD